MKEYMNKEAGLRDILEQVSRRVNSAEGKGRKVSSLSLDMGLSIVNSSQGRADLAQQFRDIAGNVLTKDAQVRVTYSTDGMFYADMGYGNLVFEEPETPVSRVKNCLARLVPWGDHSL